MSWGSFQHIPAWPREEEVDDLIELVVLNVGISQQLFDPRAVLDKVDLLHKACTQLPQLWIAELCLVFAVGRLLQAREDVDGELPGTALFKEAARRTPVLTELRVHGVLGIEVKALTALYLQITDRKEDAYLQSSAALRLAIINGFHRYDPTHGRYGSEKVRRNRLWWSLRLCAAGGYPMSIEDYAISVAPPYDAVGHSPATAMVANVRIARVAGNIVSGIYSDKEEEQSLFVTNVQNILRSLHDIESTMPSEYVMEFKQSGVQVSGRSFFDVPAAIARTSASLYSSVYTAVIHAVRPILLYMARNVQENPSAASMISPPLRRLAEICVEGASKTLVILQALQHRNVIAKHTFLDLEATFSAAHVFVLVDAIAPSKRLGADGINGCKSILRYLAGLGNRAAAKRLTELNRMCRNLAFTVPHNGLDGNTSGSTCTSATSPIMSNLVRPFSFDRGFHNGESDGDPENSTIIEGSTFEITHGQPQSGFDLSNYDYLSLNAADLAGVPLDLMDDLYGVYHTDMPLTGIEQTDWEALANQTFVDFES
ncbi:hypothetical protein IQ07DRAFT_524339 [Pyrenochaeta sp. DS3sAY3a]|nr:hypothetical protein IQ07DRAFT_524339 [Pyrenochaeta sp. DS3sAY3a]